ncbi:hypothetical protein L5D93_11925 [Paenibacillus thiaminolyticus]|nr:hypothetical protein [Paenibacillus thiaminolyticus]
MILQLWSEADEKSHRQPTTLLRLPLHPYRRILEEFRGSPNPDYLENMLAQEMRLLAGQGLSDKELVLTEWNRPPIIGELTNCG